MIMEGKVKPTKQEQEEFAEELQPKPPSEQEQLQIADIKSTIGLKDAQAMELRANAISKKATSEKDRSTTHKNIVDSYNKYIETIKAKEEAGIPTTLEDQQNLIAETRLVEDSQEDILRQKNGELTNAQQ